MPLKVGHIGRNDRSDSGRLGPDRAFLIAQADRVTHRLTVDFRNAGVDSRKARCLESQSCTTYPEDSRKTELIENLKYFLLDLSSKSPHCDP